ncbi:putative TonB-dependent receptor [Klebsiella pneumoniae]|nr:putative TonB-dependent receptor [Klebsiella pneumoniae]
MKKRLWVLHPLLLASTLPALAAQSDEDSIIVSANRTHRTVAEMAQTTWVIEGQEIEQQVQGGKEFKDVLAQLIPGIDVSSQGRTNYGMNMRGRAIVVLIDGVRLNSSRTDSRQLDAIDPFNIEHIEVISGATSLYGGGSTGGLINIVTKKGQQDRQVDLEVGSKSGFANSNDHDERVAAAVSGGTDHASGRLSVAYQRFGGWYDGNTDALILDNTQTGLQHSDRLDVMGTGTIEIDNNRQLQLVTQYYAKTAAIFRPEAVILAKSQRAEIPVQRPSVHLIGDAQPHPGHIEGKGLVHGAGQRRIGVAVQRDMTEIDPAPVRQLAAGKAQRDHRPAIRIGGQLDALQG